MTTTIIANIFTKRTDTTVQTGAQAGARYTAQTTYKAPVSGAVQSSAAHTRTLIGQLSAQCSPRSTNVHLVGNITIQGLLSMIQAHNINRFAVVHAGATLK